MNVLVVGGGGREHALVWKISQSPLVKKVYCAPGNAGTESVAENISIGADKIEELIQFVQENNVELTVVGPEQPLVLGIVDAFEGKGLRAFGPSAKAAQLEGSKAFSKDLMKKYGIPTADYQVFESPVDAKKYIDSVGPVAVKADGLAAGKGVSICMDSESAKKAVDEIMEQKAFGDAGSKIVIEEFLVGEELSLLAFTDGKTVLPLDSAQDHKQAYDGDKGPNTGGMGAFSPAPIFTPELKEQVMNEVMIPAVRGMEADGIVYKGLLYAGLMLTESGPKTLEFNARFGDPETQPLLMRMKNDIVPIFQACIDGTLADHSLDWDSKTAVCVVMAAKGYPGSYEKGMEISGLKEAEETGAVVFHAGTRPNGDKVETSGGRVLGVTALGDTMDDALSCSYSAVEKITWDGIHYRKDIARRGEIK
jgi:phosphoribosylamine---glycine ligase